MQCPSHLCSLISPHTPLPPEAGDARPPAGPSACPAAPLCLLHVVSLCGMPSPSWDQSASEVLPPLRRLPGCPRTQSAIPLCSCSLWEHVGIHTPSRDVVTAATSFPVTSFRAGLFSAIFWTHNPRHSALHTAAGSSTN